jgi:hypothetical protein
LKNGEAIEQPTYSYIESNRQKETIHVEPKPVIIIEGIMTLHYKKLRDMMDLKIFVDTDSDVRLIRNIRRDVVERGRTVEMVLDRYEKVLKPMHEQFIEPTKQFADLIVPWGGENKTGIHILKTDPRSLDSLIHDPVAGFHVCTARNLRNHAAVKRMQIDLAEDNIRQDFPSVLNDGRRRLIAGCLQRENPDGLLML